MEVIPLKKIKTLLSIIIMAAIIIGIIIRIYVWTNYQNQKAEEDRRAYISQLIKVELDASTPNKEPVKDPVSGGNSGNGTLDLDDIISGSIDDSKVDSVFTNVEMLNASTFKATLNGEEKTQRLIGVDNNGSPQRVKEILESLTKIVITYDLAKTKKGETIEQIYLWNVDDKDIGNMINIQIVKQGICKTTYEGTSYSEHPNVKYSTQFVKAAKDSRK